jgi:hypothetical protein
MKTNLKTLSDTIARMEGGKVNLGTPQILEVLGKLGEHLRSLPAAEAFQLMACLTARSGRRSKT